VLADPLMKDAKKNKKSPTIKDLALKLGLSHRAVSQALNPRESTTKLRPETVKRVQRLAAEKNYRANTFARAMRTGRARIMGYFEASVGPFGYSIFGADTAIYQAAQNRGYHLMMIRLPSGNDCQTSVPRIFTELNLDALIICNAGALTPEIADAIDQTGLPVVFFNEKHSHNAVYIDDEAGSYTMTRYLVDRGYNRIFFERALPAASEHYSVEDRTRGYLRAMEEIGADPLVYYSTKPDFLDFFERTSPDALYTAGSLSAARIFRILYDTPIHVPRDVALSAYGLDWFTIEAPISLTSMKLPIAAMADHAVEMAIALLDNPKRMRIPSVAFKPALVEGQSTPSRKYQHTS